VECTGHANRCTLHEHVHIRCITVYLSKASHCLVRIILQAQSVSNNFHNLDQNCIRAVMYQNMIRPNQHSHLSCESDRFASLHFYSNVKCNNMIGEIQAIFFWTEGCAPFRRWHSCCTSQYHTTQVTVPHPVLTLWNHSQLQRMQSDAEKTDRTLQSSAMNMHSSELPFKSWVICSVHWALNFGSKGLNNSNSWQQWLHNSLAFFDISNMFHGFSPGNYTSQMTELSPYSVFKIHKQFLHWHHTQQF
jgi:hypothetical protein